MPKFKRINGTTVVVTPPETANPNLIVRLRGNPQQDNGGNGTGPGNAEITAANTVENPRIVGRLWGSQQDNGGNGTGPDNAEITAANTVEDPTVILGDRGTRQERWRVNVERIDANTAEVHRLAEELHNTNEGILESVAENNTRGRETEALISDARALRAEPTSDPVLWTILTTVGNGLNLMIAHPVATIAGLGLTGLAGTIAYHYRHQISATLLGPQGAPPTNITNININVPVPVQPTPTLPTDIIKLPVDEL